MNTLKPTLWLLAALSSVSATAVAQVAPVETGPMLPPALRKQAPAPSASGAALRVQAMSKLKIRFEQADVNASGTLTREEASGAGFGFIARHFDAIDTAKRGSVSFEELAAFMQQKKR